MKRPSDAAQNLWLLRDADGDLAKVLIVEDDCRKIGVAPTTHSLWQHRYDTQGSTTSGGAASSSPRSTVSGGRVVAELLADKPMLQDFAKKR